MELLKNYDIIMLCHRIKATMVYFALSRRFECMGSLAYFEVLRSLFT